MEGGQDHAVPVVDAAQIPEQHPAQHPFALVRLLVPFGPFRRVQPQQVVQPVAVAADLGDEVDAGQPLQHPPRPRHGRPRQHRAGGHPRLRTGMQAQPPEQAGRLGVEFVVGGREDGPHVAQFVVLGA
ncbi:hypothetical protein GCM10022630_38900 [Thermobifida alba]